MRQLGCGSPATCWRRLTEWANAGISLNSIFRPWTASASKGGRRLRRAMTAEPTVPGCDRVGSGRGSPGAGVTSSTRLGRHLWKV